MTGRGLGTKRTDCPLTAFAVTVQGVFEQTTRQAHQGHGRKFQNTRRKGSGLGTRSGSDIWGEPVASISKRSAPWAAVSSTENADFPERKGVFHGDFRLQYVQELSRNPIPRITGVVFKTSSRIRGGVETTARAVRDNASPAGIETPIQQRPGINRGVGVICLAATH